MNRLALLLLSVACSTNVYGAIGESEAEIKARYGAPTETMPTESAREVWKAYKADGRIIYVAFLDGRSHMESYKLPNGAALARADIDTLLKANANGAEWQSDTSATGGKERWVRFNAAGEEQAVALYDPQSAHSPFSVMTPTFRDYRKQQQSR